MNFYDHYKPLRNRIRRLPLEPSLLHAWSLSLDSVKLRPFPPYQIQREPFPPIRPITYPWIVDLLIRELVLEAQPKGDLSLLDWRDLAETINAIRRVQDRSFLADRVPMDVMVELHRISHHQFHWQIGPTQNSYTRALRIFGAPAVEALFSRTYGMTIKQAVLMGILLYFGYQEAPIFEDLALFQGVGIPADAVSKCFSRLSSDLPTLRGKLRDAQRYNNDWPYTMNWLVNQPLIRVPIGERQRWFCPVPRHLVNRMTSGLFFDIGQIKDFENPYGAAFSTYVGDVLTRVGEGTHFTLTPEQRFFVAGEPKDGPDWVWSDATGVLFIEAKTKRITLAAKVDGSGDALDKQVDILADAVVQNYQNLQLGLDGHMPHWQPDGRPIYSIIVTIEEWHLLGSRAQQRLADTVKQRLVDRGFDPAIADRHPFMIASITEIEWVSQVMTKVGIAPVIERKLRDAAFPHSGLGQCVHVDFDEESRSVSNGLFIDELNELLELAQRQFAEYTRLGSRGASHHI